MNIKQHQKHPHLFTLELKGIQFTMSKKELGMLKNIIIILLRDSESDTI